MNPRSLRLRLLAASALTILASLVVAWLVMTLLFTRHINSRVASELTHQAVQLIANLHVEADGRPAVDDPPGDPRFELPGSGLYWQVSGPHQSVRSRSLWDATLPDSSLAESQEWTTRFANGPFGQRIYMLERVVRPSDTTAPVLVQVANSVTEMRATRAEFGRELGAFLALLWLLLMTSAWLQVQLGLRPLRRIREDLEVLKRDPSARLDDDRQPSEITPLVAAINDLADSRGRDLMRARRRAADLAHSLKTPLAALAAQSRKARQAGAEEASNGLDRAIAAVAAAVEAELARSRAAAIRDGRQTTVCAPEAIVERIVGVLERTEAGGGIVFAVDVDEDLRVRIAEEALVEVLGALIENAVRFGQRQVRIAAGAGQDGFLLTVEDDGKGLDLGVETALMRGGRLDEAGTEHDGLGLSIARDLVESSGGSIELGRSALGGLRVAMRWPATVLEPGCH